MRWYVIFIDWIDLIGRHWHMRILVPYRVTIVVRFNLTVLYFCFCFYNGFLAFSLELVFAILQLCP